jgi:hypothetical protein
MKCFVVDEGDKPLPVIVFSNIKPTHPLNFLLHVALSLREFSNKLEHFGDSTDIHGVFHAAKLYNLIDPVTSTKDTICCYVVEQLVHLPGGTKCLIDYVSPLTLLYSRIEWYVNNPHVRMGLPARWYPLAQVTSIAGPQKRHCATSCRACIKIYLQIT